MLCVTSLGAASSVFVQFSGLRTTSLPVGTDGFRALSGAVFRRGSRQIATRKSTRPPFRVYLRVGEPRLYERTVISPDRTVILPCNAGPT